MSLGQSGPGSLIYQFPKPGLEAIQAEAKERRLDPVSGRELNQICRRLSRAFAEQIGAIAERRHILCIEGDGKFLMAPVAAFAQQQSRMINAVLITRYHAARLKVRIVEGHFDPL